jgi:hypothetical protein
MGYKGNFKLFVSSYRRRLKFSIQRLKRRKVVLRRKPMLVGAASLIGLILLISENPLIYSFGFLVMFVVIGVITSGGISITSFIPAYTAFFIVLVILTLLSGGLQPDTEFDQMIFVYVFFLIITLIEYVSIRWLNRKHWLTKKLLIVIFVMGVCGVLGVSLTNYIQGDREFKRITQAKIELLEARYGGANKLECDPRLLGEQLSPSIVRIIGSTSEGTGFAISEHELMTSYHVIEDEPSPKIVYQDNTIELPVSMRGNKDLDIAIITVTRSFPALTTTFASEPLMQFGEPVYSIGYPNGSDMPGAPMISQGWFEGTRMIPDWLPVSFVETGMTIISGMSGGPLVDSCGHVLAVNMAAQPGLSLFVVATEVLARQDTFEPMEIGNIEVDPFTAEGVVQGFYDLMNAGRWQEAYYLMHPSRHIKPVNEWANDYRKTLHVQVVKAEASGNTVDVKLRSTDWVYGYPVTKFFEGTWGVIFAGDIYNLMESNIKEVESPGWSWYY